MSVGRMLSAYRRSPEIRKNHDRHGTGKCRIYTFDTPSKCQVNPLHQLNEGLKRISGGRWKWLRGHFGHKQH